jgi:2-polyprenyl-3-methyl-5-hydroxy-6-metoxy-1,4-benzoquinol methylase
MKYDFTLDINNPNSLSIILNQITPNSTVLEFGPAMGRMTKYMRETLECKVYIVELDEEGFNSAMQFAEEGYLGNAELIEWKGKFKDLKFDYITFADVIEHLKNPEEVISNARTLLKDNGKLILSVPNVANNAIIIDLINNKFNYRNIGLLDNTHIKFFTYYTLHELFAKCNLVVTEERATYAQPNETEFLNNYSMVSKQLEYALKDKEFGSVYQFVFTAVKKERYISEQESIITSKYIKRRLPLDDFKIYIDSGSGLDERYTLAKAIYTGENTVNFDISGFEHIDNLRLDFTEDSCILRINKIRVDGVIHEIESLQGNYEFHNENYFIFNKQDPYLFVKGLHGKYNTFEIEFYIEKYFESHLGSKYLNYFINTLNHISEENNSQNEEVNSLTINNEQLKDDNENLNNTINWLNEKIKLLEDEAISKTNEISKYKIELENKVESLNDTNSILIEKVKKIELIEDELSSTNESIVDLSELLEIKDVALEKLEIENSYLKKSLFTKVKDKIKSRLNKRKN